MWFGDWRKHLIARRALLLTVASGLIVQGVPALADDLQEVVVTARKRTESILKVQARAGPTRRALSINTTR